MWTIKRIDEADFGCEERLPGEPLMVLVSLECDDGRMLQLEVADNWILIGIETKDITGLTVRIKKRCSNKCNYA